jgi:hypothetical protein
LCAPRGAPARDAPCHKRAGRARFVAAAAAGLLADLAANERRRGALVVAGNGAVLDWCARSASQRRRSA